MKPAMLIFLTLCAFVSAMVPLERNNTASESSKPEICAPQTPCAWSIYKPNIKIVQYNITNTYCICGHNTTCRLNEDDATINTFVFRCRDASSTDDES